MNIFLKSVMLTFVAICLAVLTLQPRLIKANSNYAFTADNSSPLVPPPVEILTAERADDKLVFTIKNVGTANLKHFAIKCQGPDGKDRYYPTGRRIHDPKQMADEKYLKAVPDITVKPGDTLTVTFPTNHNPVNARLHFAVFDNEQGWLQGLPVKKQSKLNPRTGGYWDADKQEEDRWWAKRYPERTRRAVAGPLRASETLQIGFGQNFASKYLAAPTRQGGCYNYWNMSQSACEDVGYCPGGEGACFTRITDELFFFFWGTQYQPQNSTLACYWTLTPYCQCGWKEAPAYWTACM